VADDLPAARLRLGLALTALCALCYGSIPSFVRLAYAGGADALGVMLLRSVFAALAVAAMALAAGRALLPPRDLRWTGVTIGFVWLAGAWSYLGSFKRIPIGLAVTIFYLFPLIVALIARVIEGERLSRHRAASLLVGFLGVMLAVGASFARIDLLGVALAAVAALGVAVNMTISARIMRRSNPQAAMLTMTGTSAAALAALAPVVGCSLPVTALGWFGLAMATALFVCAMTCFYTAISMIGSIRTAMVCNLEPVAATAMAFLILGEAPGPIQLAGIALVIGAILWMQLGDRKA
jgi:drug/metabolite transporter (DMT)-like permease